MYSDQGATHHKQRRTRMTRIKSILTNLVLTISIMFETWVAIWKIQNIKDTYKCKVWLTFILINLPVIFILMTNQLQQLIIKSLMKTTGSFWSFPENQHYHKSLQFPVNHCIDIGSNYESATILSTKTKFFFFVFHQFLTFFFQKAKSRKHLTISYIIKKGLSLDNFCFHGNRCRVHGKMARTYNIL